MSGPLNLSGPNYTHGPLFVHDCINAAILSREFQISKVISKISMESIDVDETDVIILLDCSNSLICCQFEIKFSFFQICSHNFIMAHKISMIVLSSRFGVIEKYSYSPPSDGRFRLFR
jgi:hypothetical protein